MKTILLPALSLVSPAQTCREVVRDASGRIVQTIDRQKSSGGTVQATTRDASGRIIGTATTNPNAGGSAQTHCRDASGRLTGTASTQPPTGMRVKLSVKIPCFREIRALFAFVVTTISGQGLFQGAGLRGITRLGTNHPFQSGHAR